MAAEAKRGCGHRKVGAMYLVGKGLTKGCDRLPFMLPEVCPCCGAGIKQARGWTWVQAEKLLGGNHLVLTKRGQFGCMLPGQKKAKVHTVEVQPPELCPEDLCPVCRPIMLGKRCGLLWVGRAHYTPAEFIQEAQDLGVSKRIAQVPKGLQMNDTWVLLAHPDACPPDGPAKFGADPEDQPKPRPGIFYAFLPQAVEKIVTKTQYRDGNEMAKLQKRGITPVPVPDGDADHR